MSSSKFITSKLKYSNKRSILSFIDAGSSPESSHSSEEACPDFPPLTVPLESEVSSAHTSDGRLLAVGDIVWGKIHGFPWWPGKVNKFVC